MTKIVNRNMTVNEERGVVIITIIDEFGHSFKGKSKCNEEDTFDIKFGEKLAYLRAKQKMLKFYYKINIRQLEETRQRMADFEKRMDVELEKTNYVLNKTNKHISDMLNQI